MRRGFAIPNTLTKSSITIIEKAQLCSGGGRWTKLNSPFNAATIEAELLP